MTDDEVVAAINNVFGCFTKYAQEFQLHWLTYMWTANIGTAAQRKSAQPQINTIVTVLQTAVALKVKDTTGKPPAHFCSVVNSTTRGDSYIQSLQAAVACLAEQADDFNKGTSTGGVLGGLIGQLTPQERKILMYSGIGLGALVGLVLLITIVVAIVHAATGGGSKPRVEYVEMAPRP